MSWRGAFGAVLALVALEAVVRTDESADRVGGALTTLADLLGRAMSPAVAAIPDLRGDTSSSIGAPGSGTVTFN